MTVATTAPPIVLSIAGSDTCGGAGIQADIKTISACGAYAMTAITAITTQDPNGVRNVWPVTVEQLGDQIEATLAYRPAVIKIGMLGNAELIETVADGLERHNAKNIVLDPVMIAASGARLLEADAVEAIRRHLFPLATLITPNIPEAAALLETSAAETDAAVEEQAEKLAAFGAANVLIKGGHGHGDVSSDLLLMTGGTRQRFNAPRYHTRNTHGTGCTLSSAIAAGLARGLALPDAIGNAKSYITAAIAAADQVPVGHGHGPVHHFHHWWQKTDGRQP